MVFIAPSPKRLFRYLIFTLLLAASLAFGHTTFAFALSERTAPTEAAPTISISATPSQTGAGATATYTITTSEINSTASVTVNFRMKGTAKWGSHYTLDAGRGTIVIPAGANSASITLNALSRDLTTGDKVATMKLMRGVGYRLGPAKKASVIITNTLPESATVAALEVASSPTPVPAATPASSPTQEIWIAVRHDGHPGSGTQDDPFDGSTPEKLDAILYNYYFTQNLGVHLIGSAEPFRTYANHVWAVQPGWVLSGDGIDVTTIKMVGSVAGLGLDVDVLKSDPNIATNNATIKDLTVDCNWAELAFTADEGLGARSVTDAVITQNSPLITSSTAAFTYIDYAKTLTGGGIPPGTKILSIQDAHHATMSANAIVGGSGVSVLIGGEKHIKVGAIILWGSNNLVDHVRCINSYGSLANGMELFAIEISGPRSGDGTNNVVQYCRVESPQGNHGAPFGMFGWAPHLITNSGVIRSTAVGNAGGFSWSDPSIGFPSGGVNFGYIQNCKVDSNTFIDCEGAAYTDTGSCDGFSVTNNTVIRGELGVGLTNPELPKRKIEISGNNFLIQNRVIGGSSYGIASLSGTTNDLTVSNNTITFDTSGGGSLEFWGIALQELNNALICNNVIGQAPNSILANRAIGVRVVLSHNHTPNGLPVPGL